MSVTVDNKRVTERITEKFGSNVQPSGDTTDILTVITDRNHIIELLEFLSHDEELQFIFLTDICGVHYPDRAEKFEVVYHLHSFIHNIRLRLKVTLPSDLKIPTATSVFKGANWMERETFDFFGIIFEGHPNLKRILNVDEMTIFPMRKEFPLEDNTRVDKNDSMFGR